MNQIKSGIEKGNKLWIKAFKEQDADMLANAFHMDGAVLGAGGRVIEGREAIRSHFRDWMQEIGSSVFTIETIDVYDVSGDIFEKGQYTLIIENGNRYEGKYIVEWKCENGEYLFFRDIGI
jgi:uncharacterized protein (TIGR02246 family)